MSLTYAHTYLCTCIVGSVAESTNNDTNWFRIARWYVCKCTKLYQNYQFGCVTNCLVKENIGIFLSILNILRPFGISFGHLEYCSCLGMLYREKSGNTEFVPSRASHTL
jgi:hypothetical protein